MNEPIGRADSTDRGALPAGPFLRPRSTEDRSDAAAFAARVARWDPMTLIRLRQDGDLVRMYAGTPFDALVMRAVSGTARPGDLTVHAGNLLAGLAVAVRESVDPGPVVDSAWRSQLPPTAGWVYVDQLPSDMVSRLSDEGVATARANPGPAGGAPSVLLDSEVLAVSGAGMSVSVSMRMLFALSGMAFSGPNPGEAVRVRATDSWVRLDARYGSVLRRRHALLPLLF